MKTSLLDTLANHRFLAGIPRGTVARFGERAQLRHFPTGLRIFAEGAPADRFWLIGDGRVGLDLHTPGRGTLTVETLGAGALLGWSWLCPPYRWRFGAVAVLPTSAVELDADAVRALCDADPAVGYLLAGRVLMAVADRLYSTRVRLLDVYGPPVRH